MFHRLVSKTRPPASPVQDQELRRGHAAAQSRRDGANNNLPFLAPHFKTANVNGVAPYDHLVWLDDTVRSLLLNWELRSTLPKAAPT
jgi:hypothetical protein